VTEGSLRGRKGRRLGVKNKGKLPIFSTPEKTRKEPFPRRKKKESKDKKGGSSSSIPGKGDPSKERFRERGFRKYSEKAFFGRRCNKSRKGGES